METGKVSHKRRRKEKEPIPTFQSREEEANFWDSHDLSDYWNEFEAVEVKVDMEPIEGLTIHLDEATFARLRVVARARGIDPAALARKWIIERLNAHEAQPVGTMPIQS